MLKRLFDIFASSFGLILMAPFFIVIAILIKLDSPGPVFFRQTRMGKGFQPFSILKFRTMVKEASKLGGPLTVAGDTRITKFGRFLRENKIDELPQLWNILKGEMSVVGPRPEVQQYSERFQSDFASVLSVRPGLTDLASLWYLEEASLLSQAADPEKDYLEKVLPHKLKFAHLYLQHQSFWFDLAVMGQTLINLLGIKYQVLQLPALEFEAKKSPPRLWTLLRMGLLEYRRPLIVLFDLALVSCTNYCAFWLRFDGMIPAEVYQLFWKTLPWLIICRAMAFYIFRLNEGLWRYTSLWDLQRIVGGVFFSTLIFFILVDVDLGYTGYPRTVYVIDSLLLIIGLVAVRLPFRYTRELAVWRKQKGVLIVGTEDAAARVVQDMKMHPSYQYYPIGLVANHRLLVGTFIHGVRVLGTIADIAQIVTKRKPEEVVIALDKSHPTIIQDIVKVLASFEVPIKTLPSIQEALEGRATLDSFRSLNIEDVMSRKPVNLDFTPLQQCMKGKCILVTGAGGSIGSELCRQIVELKPESLILYERHEHSLYHIQIELEDKGKGAIVEPVLGDVTDRKHFEAMCQRYRPSLIFHAAAYKHVPLLQELPIEAIQNNVLGTYNVVRVAEKCQVERCVLISTDKAVEPTSVMGASKRVAELIVQDRGAKSTTEFLTVRFGNVLGSTGSVVPRFVEQINAGGPVTVTHPDIQRYFMLIPEAINLVLHAAALGEGNRLYILDMGEQIRIVDLAETLIRLAGYQPGNDIEIEFSGLRPGEKLFEMLNGPSETIRLSHIPHIFEVTPEPLPSSYVVTDKIEELRKSGNIVLQSQEEALQWLQAVVPAFQLPQHEQTMVLKE